MAISKSMHAQVRGAIAQFCASNDVGKVSAREVYDQLYPDQVDFGTFLQHWEGRDNVADLNAHQALLDKVSGEVTATKSPAQLPDPVDPAPKGGRKKKTDAEPAPPQS